MSCQLASAAGPLAGLPGFVASRCIFLNASYIAMNERYSAQVTSHLPIQKGSTFTRTCGPSSVAAVGFGGRATHQELATGNGDHFEGDVGAGNFFV